MNTTPMITALDPASGTSRAAMSAMFSVPVTAYKKLTPSRKKVAPMVARMR